MLYNIIILPIETIVDWIFTFIRSKISVIGVMGAVVGVSLAINFLALPLYNIADSLQEKERKIAKSLEKWSAHIKRTFKGDEQFMMLSAFYKINNYHPLYVLRSSLSILIEIPFFIAAYHYLSHNEALKGASWWIFENLGEPDNLLKIGNISIHILPIIMTLINVVSGAVYAKEAPFHEKAQLYGIAAIFLYLLYNSPSGLVLYWIMNNIFSLAKNIVMKMENPGRILHIAITTLFVLVSAFFICKPEVYLWKKLIVVTFSACIAVIPFIGRMLSGISKRFVYTTKKENGTEYPIFLISCIGLAILSGLVVPASVIASSPIEFSFLGNTASPVSYIWYTLWFFTGLFVFWPNVIYKMFDKNVKKWMTPIFFACLIISLLNVFVFKSDYGDLNAVFEVRNTYSLLNLEKSYAVLPLIISLVIFALIIVVYKRVKCLPVILCSLIIAELGLGIYKSNKILSSYHEYCKNNEKYSKKVGDLYDKVEPYYHLSITGKNVIVLFLDRAIGNFVPEIFSEFSDIKNKFQGFIDYQNTISFSDYTLEGTPAMLGGYEYTQENMNERSEMLLKDKHNEALLVMPKLFSDAGFEVTVTDPPWSNYRWEGDLTPFDKYPEFRVKELEGAYKNNYLVEKGLRVITNVDDFTRKGAVAFSVLQLMYPAFRGIFYFSIIDRRAFQDEDFPKEGEKFLSQISNLYYLSELTDFKSENDTYTFIENEATHEVYLSLDESYERPSKEQNYDETIRHYQANVAALKQIGKWLDYLRENNCYDNTRIIIVSDHGRSGIDIPCKNNLVAKYGSMLLFKDFYKNEDVQENYMYMTNADTLFLAKKDLNLAERNPFTGNLLVQNKNSGNNVYHCIDINGENFRDKTQFILDKQDAYHVSDNIFNPDNWIPLIEWEKSQEASK